LYNNTLGNYNGVSAGEGDISVDPLFADPDNGDFHLKSQYGRWNGSVWVIDDVTSPCIDAGDPEDDYSNEPEPNGGRINLGAYGNTPEASKSSGVDTTPPTIIANSPTGENVSIDTTISVTFSEAMNKTSAEGAFSISPSVSGSFSWDGNKMIFTPDSNLAYNTTYTANISTSAKDLAGNNLESPYSWQFTTIEEDTTPPVISDIQTSYITSNSATITWTTDEPSTSLVKYGTTSGSYPYSQEDTSYTTSHSITLTNLQANTTYYFVVNSTDKAGNSAQSSEDSFTTLSAPKEGDVILWDTNKKYDYKYPFWDAYNDRANWTQVPYGTTNYTFKGDAMIENGHYFLFLYSYTGDCPDLRTKFGDDRFGTFNEIYKVYDTGGIRDFGHGAVWTEIIKNTPEEVIVKSVGKGHQTGLNVTTIYRITKRPWLEVQPVERVNQQGIHDKSRLAAFVFKNVSKDILLDANKHGDFIERINPPEGCIGEINFQRRLSSDEDYILFLTFPPGVETNSLTYQTMDYPDCYWEWDCRCCVSRSVSQNFAYLGEKVIIATLNFKDNWKREDVNKYLSKGDTYTSSFTAPYAGKWRIVGVYSDDDYYITDYFSEVEVNEGEHFTFTSPRNGTLEYLVMYMFDRTENTPENITTIMDVYREAIGGDITPPNITNVHVSAADNFATITWNTDEKSNSLVKYGTESGIYTNITGDTSYVISHSITLTG
ncbi:MAG: hypothetical protein DRP08_07515, partial [Candidatus Aenigmatarchaeota archaeon]